jgi:predicted outer membrane repeat protein
LYRHVFCTLKIMKAMMQKRFSVIILLLLCLVSLPAFAVTRYVKPGGAGTFPYTTWATGSSDLQVVINACNPGDQVWVKNSVYLPTRDITGNASPADVREKTFLLKSGVLIYGGFAGTETLLNQRNVIVNETILSGNIGDVFNSADNCYHVTYANNVTAATRLDGFTVREGNADGTGSTYSGSGGGLLNDKGQNYLTISNCNFSANTALSGAGILNSVGALGNCSPNIINCSFSLNNATGIGSGGGAISNNGYNGTSNTIIDKCRFIDNFGYNGGAVDFNAGATGSSAVTITNSLFLNNSASTGGALKITSFNDISLSAIITNCVFVSNTASNAGGAIYYGFSAGSLATTITNCSFLGNFAGTNSGGVLYVGGSVVSPNPIIKNCIAWDNSSSFDFFAGNNVTVSYSCIQSGFPGTGNISSNPFFVNAADPDGADNIWGTTDDGLRVMPISESLDKGTLTGAPGTDITGGTRPQGAGIDMGAYETYVCPLTSRLYVDESQVANSTANGTGWASPLKSLNDALQLASVSICSITEIWVKAGTYKPERDYL